MDFLKVRSNVVKFKSSNEVSEGAMPGDNAILGLIRKLSFERDAKGVVEACDRYKASGGALCWYGYYLYPALTDLGDFDAALHIANECSDDTNTPVDELKILFLAKRWVDVIRHSQTIIENSFWFSGGRDVVDAHLMRAEALRMNGNYFRAWQDVLSAYQSADQTRLGPKVLADIRAIGKRIRREAAEPALALSLGPSSFVPVLLGGPHYER